MTQRFARAGIVLLQLLCITLLAFPVAVRSRLYRQLYPLIAVEAHQLSTNPDTLRAIGYSQDDPADLTGFRTLAEQTIQGAVTDGQRLRKLGDMLYALRRPGAPLITGGREQGVQTLLARLQRGEHGLCGHNTAVLAALWRSLGRDFREIRFTMNDRSAWYAAHYGIEVYLPNTQRWMYYDVGLNGSMRATRSRSQNSTSISHRAAMWHSRRVGAIRTGTSSRS